MLLAIDTATPQVGVALWGDEGPIGCLRAAEGRRHGELLAPAIGRLVSGSGRTMADLTAVAVDVGPGLFTGLRVGLATAGWRRWGWASTSPPPSPSRRSA
jgi:tRNA threonylcarbamoyladenosine biosynthesis protein TsaB